MDRISSLQHGALIFRSVIKAALTFGLALLASIPGRAAGQWESLGGPGPYEIEGLLILDRCLLASTRIGVFRSTDDGASWSAAGTPFPGDVWSPKLYASGPKIIACDISRGLYSSMDMGASWQVISGMGLPEDFTYFGFLEKDGVYFLLGLRGEGVYSSKDQGASWSPCGVGLPEKTFLGSLIVVGNDIFVYSGFEGVFRSTDNGATWTEASAGLPAEYGLHKPGRFYRPAALISSAGLLFTFRTDNEGPYVWRESEAAWVGIKLLPAEDWECTDLWADGPYVLAELFPKTDHYDPRRHFSFYFLSNDGGETWQRIRQSWHEHARVSALAAHGAYLFIGTHGGLHRSSDGGKSWEMAGRGWPRDAEEPRLYSSEKYLYANTGGYGLLRSGDFGRSWSAANAGLPGFGEWGFNGPVGFAEILARIGPDLFAANPFNAGVLFTRGASGTDWKPVKVKLPKETDIECLAAAGGNLLAGTDRGLYLSADLGRSWSRGKGLGGFDLLGDCFIEVIGENVFAASDDWDNLFRSGDRGLTWKPVKIDLPGSPRFRCLAGSGQEIFLGTDSGLFVSRDDGRSWQPSGQGLPEAPHVTGLVSDGKSLVCGVWTRSEFIETEDNPEVLNYHAFFRSDDGGKSWAASTEGLPVKFGIRHMARAGRRIFAVLNSYQVHSPYGGGSRLNYSSDGGRTWIEVGLSKGIESDIVRLLGGEGELVVATSEYGLWRLKWEPEL